MSLRPRNSQPQARNPPTPSATAIASRLDKVLQIGLSVRTKYTDGDRNTVRKVKFDSNDPKTVYKKDCLQVPWELFGIKNPSRIEMYINDVKADPRIKDIDELPPDIEYVKKATSEAQSKAIQDHANKTNNPNPASSRLWKTWVISWNQKYSRFCLVPIESISLIERLKQAIGFLQNRMDDESLTLWQKREAAALENDDNPDTSAEPEMDANNVRFRDTYVALFTSLIMYKKDCLQVPWELFGIKNPSRIEMYINDVKADPRINDIDYLPPYIEDVKKATSEAQSKAIQDHANKTNNPNRASSRFWKTWVISWNQKYSRFCLVPIESISLIERLEQAIDFLQNRMDDDNTDTSAKPEMDANNVQFRNIHVALFTVLIEQIKMQAPGKKQKY